jgi:hypothetical protein
VYWQDIERLAKLGVSVTPETLRKKMLTWQDSLDVDLVQMKNEWSDGGPRKFQLVGDNWDKNILPSYRTSQQKTLSLHLFNVIGVTDRVDVHNPDSPEAECDITDLKATDFIPSVEDQEILVKELTFLVSRAVVDNIDQISSLFEKIYPKHLDHKYSESAGLKTQQV